MNRIEAIEQTIVHPEVPQNPEAKLELLRRCLAVIASDGIVEGLSPRHVAHEGMLMIKNAEASRDKRQTEV